MSRAEGTWGEAQVANFLRRRGYQLLAHSYHCRFGEVDLIARQGSMLCFVEVKTRAETEHGLPREFVSPSKQRRIRTAAAQYLMRYALDCPVRFDVAEVYTGGVLDEANVRIEYLEAAFE